MWETLGDVHAGKKFLNDVPLHRRGERERQVLRHLEEELNSDPALFHVQVGDLFDQFRIDNETLLEVAEIYQRAAEVNRDTIYILIPGNHDLAKDATKVSSFQIFAKLVEHIPNIRVLFEPMIIDNLGFLPWDPFKSANEQAAMLHSLYLAAKLPNKLSAVFCHYDLKSYGESDHNVIPVAAVKNFTETLVTGHVHIPQEFTQEGLPIKVTGSMEPYSHGEDPEGDMYVTLTRDEFEAKEPQYFRVKYVRVKLSKDQIAPEPPDCLGFKIIYEGTPTLDSDSEGLEVKFEDFSTRGLFQTCLAELEVSPTIQAKVLEEFDKNV